MPLGATCKLTITVKTVDTSTVESRVDELKKGMADLLIYNALLLNPDYVRANWKHLLQLPESERETQVSSQ